MLYQNRGRNATLMEKSRQKEHLRRIGRLRGKSDDQLLGVLWEKPRLELWCDPMNWIVAEEHHKHFFSHFDGLLRWLVDWLLKKKLPIPLKGFDDILYACQQMGVELAQLRSRFDQLRLSSSAKKPSK